jgi:hypothetical protein
MIKYSGKKGSISLRDVGMIDHPYVKRIQELAAVHLNCALDDNDPGYVPQDLVPGTYRWYLYMYSNMFKIPDDRMTADDREMFVDISKKFLSEHLISWTRETLLEIKGSAVPDLQKYLQDVIHTTDRFFELKVSLYLLRCLSDNFLVTDFYSLKILPRIREYVVYG